MKKILFLLLVSSCTSKETPQDQAENAVKNYIKENAIDPKSYRPVSFGKLDSVYTLDSNRYYQLDITRKAILNAYKTASSSGNQRQADSLQERLIRINEVMDADRVFTGLKLYHVSEGKNEEGKTVINRGTFYFDSSFAVKQFIMTEDSLLSQEAPF